MFSQIFKFNSNLLRKRSENESSEVWHQSIKNTFILHHNFLKIFKLNKLLNHFYIFMEWFFIYFIKIIISLLFFIIMKCFMSYRIIYKFKCIFAFIEKESLNTPLDLNASSTNIPVTFDWLNSLALHNLSIISWTSSLVKTQFFSYERA